jgi:hypothetical protein
MPRSLFGSDGVVGKILGEALDDEPFRALVRLGDEIHLVAFVSNVQRARQFFDENLAGCLGDFGGGFEIVFGHGGNWELSEVSALAVRRGLFHSTISSKRGPLRSN